MAKQLMNGSWSMHEAKKLCGIDTLDHYIEKNYESYRLSGRDISLSEYRKEYGAYLEELWPETPKNLREWFELKESAVAQMGHPERWNEFMQHWNAYLDALPMEYLRERVDDLDKKIIQARHWLSVLPTAQSPERVTNGLYALEHFYAELRVYESPEHPETATLTNYDIEQATDRDFGSFGYFIPGYVVSLRTKKTIEEAIARCTQLLTYSEGFFPQVLKEERRLNEAGIHFDPETLFHYFSTLERAYTRQHFFQQRTRHAAALHGFFPYRMPGIEPQDRIIALTSVTMHGWNHLNEQGFYDELTASIQYLRDGGKYILGPINQYTYFSGIPDATFDAEGFNRALERLAAEGTITYEFHHGRREYDQEFDTFPYKDEEEEIADDADGRPRLLHNGESAHCLVITKVN